MVKVHFCSGNGIGSLAIQAALFSRWNHVAIEIGGVVFDATFTHGVACWPADTFTDRYAEVETVTLSISNEAAAAALAFLKAQLGKLYDWTALVALPFRADWHDLARWFCSELVAAALEIAQYLYLPVETNRVTPRDLRIAL